MFKTTKNPDNQQATTHNKSQQQQQYKKLPQNPEYSVPTPSSTNIPDLVKNQSKYKPGVHIGLMYPTGLAAKHPAAPLLQQYATTGCPADCGENWTWQEIESAIRRGAHPSARPPKVAAALREETLDQEKNGFVKLITLEELRTMAPPHVKISPAAAIPHKTRMFRKLLDLSWAAKGTTSVNASTNQNQAPKIAMSQLGKVLPRLIHALASAEPTTILLMAKLDIKDGFWRIVVEPNGAWNFAYVLPQVNDTDPIQIVIPLSAQMGWTLSPPYFCAATETARDVGQELTEQPNGTLARHPFETQMTASEEVTCLPPVTIDNKKHTDNFTNLLEVYVDDFIGLIEATSQADILHYSRAMLHAIHSVFPPRHLTGHGGEDPISQQKLEKGDGLWQTRKEILGWILDGINKTITLPQDKVANIMKLIQKAKKQHGLRRSDYHKLKGKLRHATFGLPVGKGIMTPLDRHPDILNNAAKWIHISTLSPAWKALTDFSTIIKHMASRPTHCRELVPGMADFVGHCDAAGIGAGGTWSAGNKPLHPLVWRIDWPSSIVQLFQQGVLTINDLEAATQLIHLCLLDGLVNLKHCHLAINCDNRSAVSWFTKMKSSRSTVGQRLVRALCLRLCILETSPLASLSIAGTDNKMADDASRLLHLSDETFLTYFNSTYPLQDASWKLLRPTNLLLSRVFSEMHGRPSTMASWMRLPKRLPDIGTIGDVSAPTITWTRGSQDTLTDSKLIASSLLLNGSGKETPGALQLLELKRSKSRFAPSARPSNWMNRPTPSTNWVRNTTDTGNDSNINSNPSADKIHPANPN